MGLEKRVHGNIFKRVAIRVAPILLIAVLAGCPERRGPISVENSITPSSIQSGSYGSWEVKVTNLGGTVNLGSASAYERIVSGWGAGESASAEIMVEGMSIPAHSTATIFRRSFLALNTGYSDLGIENTVTVTSDGGDDSNTTFYRIPSAYSSTSSSRGEKSRAVGAVFSQN